MYKIAITNRHLCKGDLIHKIAELKDYKMVILREKDLSESEYFNIAKYAIKVNDNVILHTFIDTAIKLNYKKIHLPYNIFTQNIEILKDFDIVGVSTHSVKEAVMCQELGADYITASHIFATDCKKGIEPKGLDFLKEVCDSVYIPVYALGGIKDDNARSCIDAGAKGVCMMSQAMR